MTETVSDIISLHNKYVIPTYAPGLLLVRGKGTRVWDNDGKDYLDFIAGIAVINCGHNHPAVTGAIQKQAERLTHVSNLFYNEKQPLLAKALAERSLGGKCFFCNSGAEANEGLIKLARLKGCEQGRYEIITMRNSFHGRTLATLTATGQDKVKQGFAPLPEGFKQAEFNDLESCRAAMTKHTIAILVEPVQGEGGVVPAEPGFLQGLRELCDENDLLLLYDEVQTGMGRTGHWFGYQYEGVVPDAFSLAKGLGNGFPIGALVSGPELADTFQPGHHATTFGGTPLACAAALAVIETIERENLLQNAQLQGDYLLEGLRRISREYDFVTGARGRGLMLGLVLDRNAKDMQDLLTAKGLITLATAEKVLRMLPPLTVSRQECEQALSLVDEVCREISS